MKFEKIYETEDGGQILVKAYFKDREGMISLETILPNGVTAQMENKVDFEGFEKRFRRTSKLVNILKMNREIKFRGKIIDNTEEWVYGTVAYSEDEKRAYIVEFLEFNQRTGVDYKFHEVSLSTIGQYTGLKDKNGRDIYEGDLLSDGHRHMQVFQLKTGEWVLKQKGYCCNTSLCMGLKFCEVVGNIHNNPELLGQ